VFGPGARPRSPVRDPVVARLHAFRSHRPTADQPHEQMGPLARTADPWTDTAVIDARAPRTNQAIVGTLSLLAFATGWWPILGLLAAQLAIGLRFGRRWCLPCLLYFDVIQPRFGEGPIE